MAGRALLAQATTTPAIPPAVADAAARWSGPLELPPSLPDCLRYTPGGSAVVPNSQSRSGWTLAIRLEGVPAGTPGCAGWERVSVLLQEGDALASLPGDVTTISVARLQFARVAEATPGGQTQLTLQWRCHDLMCRATTALGGPLDETQLARLAASFVQVAN